MKIIDSNENQSFFGCSTAYRIDSNFFVSKYVVFPFSGYLKKILRNINGFLFLQSGPNVCMASVDTLGIQRS